MRKQVMTQQLDDAMTQHAPSTLICSMEARLAASTDELIALQAQNETLASERATLLLRLETAEEALTSEMEGCSGQDLVRMGSSSIKDVDQQAELGILSRDNKDKPTKPQGFEIWVLSVANRTFGVERTRQLAGLFQAVDAMSLGWGSLIGQYREGRVAAVMYLIVLHVWVMIVYMFG